MHKLASAEALDLLDGADDAHEAAADLSEQEEAAALPKSADQQYRDQAGGPMRKATREQVWAVEPNVMGTMYRAQIAPDIAYLTGHKIGAVILGLQQLEREGKIRKTGEQRQSRFDGLMYDLWERVPA